MAELVGVFVCGMVAGAFLLLVWVVDRPSPVEPTEHGGHPL